ncbi:hypothetical protein ONZ43_g7656 [Nemania bipapillata]|uniref:Uncharacterized protein n=1 Tax=Nemania bipapillata TaxID=110536 RepID=A0ACC2HP55_9PEZI|nr:hypothetical protein ONZ43_g7656 [Nemania bipapillata]
MAALLNFWSSPNKQNGTSADTRGTKRKAKADPYEPMEEEPVVADSEEWMNGTDDEDDIIPARKTPTSQRTARSRLSSATPGSSTRPRVSVTGKRPRGRPSLKSQQGDTSDVAVPSRIDAEANSVRAKAPNTKPMQPDSLVPEAPMGGLELLGNNTANASAASVPVPEPKTTVDETAPKDKGKSKQTETMSTEQAGGEEAEVEQKEENDVEEGEGEGEDAREEHEIEKLLKHRMTPHGN